MVSTHCSKCVYLKDLVKLQGRHTTSPQKVAKEGKWDPLFQEIQIGEISFHLARKMFKGDIYFGDGRFFYKSHYQDYCICRIWHPWIEPRT